MAHDCKLYLISKISVLEKFGSNSRHLLIATLYLLLNCLVIALCLLTATPRVPYNHCENARASETRSCSVCSLAYLWPGDSETSKIYKKTIPNTVPVRTDIREFFCWRRIIVDFQFCSLPLPQVESNFRVRRQGCLPGPSFGLTFMKNWLPFS